MEEMSAFERQIASVVQQTTMPPRPVDAMPIMRTATATRPSGRTIRPLFNATKLAVAGAIVALFGGFLLAGVLTQPSEESAPAASPSPMTTDELLSRMTTEEVDPGVYRVLADGAGHDLTVEVPKSVTVGADGSVWLLSGPGGTRREYRDDMDTLFELGRGGTYAFEPKGRSWLHNADMAIDSGGVAWVGIGAETSPERDAEFENGRLASFDGEAWASATWPDGSSDVSAIDAAADGSVWFTRIVRGGPGPAVARLQGGEWTTLPVLEDPSPEGWFHGMPQSFAVGADGTAWLANGGVKGVRDADEPGPTDLLHFDGERWEVVELPIEGGEIHAGPLALGSDGTLWVSLGVVEGGNLDDLYLARLDEAGWTVFSSADGVPQLVTFEGPAQMAVDGSGRLWIAAGPAFWETDQPGPLDGTPEVVTGPEGFYGALMFDGTGWHQYLAGLRVMRLDIAADATVFATALHGCPADFETCDPEDVDWSQGGLYVITPEAVAANE